MTAILILMGLLLMSWVIFCGIQDILFPPLWRPAKKWMAAMVAGGVLILGVMGGITSVVSKHNEEKTENIRQQR